VIPNIGPRGQAQRRRFGFIALAAAALLLVLLTLLHLPRAWRLLEFLPLWLSALGFFQARDKT
jgi:hypothetical protein